MSITALMDHLCVVHRVDTETVDSYGDVIGAFVAQPGTERLAIVPPKLRNANYGAGTLPAGTVEGYMRAGADVRNQDILDVTSGPEAPSKWRVAAPPIHPRGNHTELVLEPYTGDIA